MFAYEGCPFWPAIQPPDRRVLVVAPLPRLLTLI
jgi:hypothetical protein